MGRLLQHLQQGHRSLHQPARRSGRSSQSPALGQSQSGGIGRMSEWWENPVVRMPRFNSLPISMKMEELGSQIAVEEVLFKREQWVNFCDIVPKFKEYIVKGVTGAKYWKGDWF